jgi:hypothetical protein
MQSVLVVTIDTEEEGLFGSEFPRGGQRCENVLRLPRIHEVFRRVGAVPTYLVDHPVACDEAASDTLRALASDGPTEIGAHMHPWCTPPFTDADRRTTYAHQLPTAVQEAKLRRLCALLAQRFGVWPTSYRAGRWAFDRSSIPALEAVGIRVDGSVNPLWWTGGAGGPMFVQAPLRPYRLHRDDATRPGQSGVVEVPLSKLVTVPLGAHLERVLRWVGPRPGLKRAFEALGLASLRPELYGLRTLRRVADAVARRGLPVFQLMIHSSAARPGATPYVRTERELDRFVGRLESILSYIRSRYDPLPLRLSDVPTFLGERVLQGNGS